MKFITKTLYYLISFLLPLILLKKYFYDTTTYNGKIQLGLFVATFIIIAIYFYRRYKILRMKQQANETVKALGQTNQDIHPKMLVVHRMIDTIIIFSMIIWFVNIIEKFSNDMTTILIHIGLCLLLGFVFLFISESIE